MATLTPVSVSLPRDKIPTKQILKTIIATFLPYEWPSVDADSLTMTYNASFVNAHCSVQRPRPSPSPSPNTEPAEPLRLFIKFHKDAVADIQAFKHLIPSRQDEARLCHQYGQSGLGAKVYGFFATLDGTLGRIDEFLDARTLEPQDVEDASIRADIATALATFHTLRAPLEKSPVEAYYDAVMTGLSKYHRADKLKRLGRQAGVNIDDLIDYDFASKLRVLTQRLDAVGAKSAWCIHDVQFMNTLVRNHPPENGDGKQSKVVLIDFEFVMRNYRCFDIGGHFFQKMFKWFNEESRIAKCRPYTTSEKEHFCEEYARQWNARTGDTDTAEMVLAEAEHGYLAALTFDIHNMLCFMDDEDAGDVRDLVALNKLFGEFVQNYGKLGLEDVMQSLS